MPKDIVGTQQPQGTLLDVAVVYCAIPKDTFLRICRESQIGTCRDIVLHRKHHPFENLFSTMLKEGVLSKEDIHATDWCVWDDVKDAFFGAASFRPSKKPMSVNFNPFIRNPDPSREARDWMMANPYMSMALRTDDGEQVGTVWWNQEGRIFEFRIHAEGGSFR